MQKAVPEFFKNHQALTNAESLAEAKIGWIIGQEGGQLLRLRTDKHMVTIANTGGGKGTSAAISNLLTHPGSAFSIEIGGATYNATHQVRRFALGQNVHVIDPYGAVTGQSSHLNLLDTLDPESPRFFNEVKLFAGSMLKNDRGSSSQDRYWEDVPKQALMAFLIYVRASPSIASDKRHLPHVAELLSLYGSADWTGLMKDFANYDGVGSQVVRSTGNYFSKDPNENTDGIISSIQSAMTFAYDPSVAAISRDSSFKLSDLRDRKSSIYVVMPEAEDYAGLSTWLRLLVERSFSACPNLGDGGRQFNERHEDRVLFMLDEFTQLGRLDAVDVGMQTARQKGVTIWAMFQDVGRLQSVYGDKIADSMLGAAGVTQVFDIGDTATLEYVSKRLGQKIEFLPQYQEGQNGGTSGQLSMQAARSLGKNTSESETDTESTGLGDAYYRVLKEDLVVHVSRPQELDLRDNLKPVTINQAIQKGLPKETWFNRVPVYEDKTHLYFRKIDDAYHGEMRDGDGMRPKGLDREYRENININKGSSTQNGTGTSEQDTTTIGMSGGQTDGWSTGESHNAQLVPKLSPSQAEVLLGTGHNQLLFIRAAINGREREVCHAIHARAPFFEHPDLVALANGKWDFKEPPSFSPVTQPQSPERLPFPEVLAMPLPELPELSPAAELPAPVFKPVDPLASALSMVTDEADRKAVADVWLSYASGRPAQDTIQEMQRDHAMLADIVFPSLERAGFEVTGTIESARRQVRLAWNALAARQEGVGSASRALDNQSRGLLGAAAALDAHAGALNGYLNALDTTGREYGQVAQAYQDH